MKRFLPLLFVLMTFNATAQIVNIPDPNFKAALINPICEDMGFGVSVDLNHDGEIQVSEAATFTELTIKPCGPIADISGIEAFVNLKKLHYLNYGSLTSLDLTSLTNLEEFDFGDYGVGFSGNTSIHSLNFAGLTQLKKVIVSNASLSGPNVSSINIAGCNNLRRLECSGNSLTSLSLTNMPSLDTLICNNSSTITSLDVHGCSNLSRLECNNNTALVSLDAHSCPNLSWLRLQGTTALTTLNLNGCSSLPDVFINPGVLTTLNVGNCSSVQNVVFSNNQVSSLNMAGSNNITGLYCKGNLLTSLDLSGRSNLIDMDFSSNPLITSVDFTGCSSLLEIKCNDMQLGNLPISGCNSLTKLECRNNQLTSLDISSALNLNWLDCSNNQLSGTLDISNRPNLLFVNCRNNQLTGIMAENCSYLYDLEIAFNSISSINVNGCDTLTMISAYTNMLPSLDVSMLPELKHITVGNNPPLAFLNIKNGNTINSYFNAQENPNLHYVCADDGEVLTILNNLVNSGMTNVSVNPYCSFVPGGQFNTIHGTVKLDLNNNGCDVNDNTLYDLRVKIQQGTDSSYSTVDASGHYNIYTYAGSYTVAPQFQHPYFNFTPATVNFPLSDGSVQDVDFCIIKTGVHPDIDITMIPINVPRPGFDVTYKLVFKNKGTEALSGNVSLNYDDNKLNFLTGPTPTTQSAGLLSWAYSNLQPFESRTLDLKFNLLPPPVNNIDDTINFTTNIDPLAADETPLDNGFALQQVVRGSFDPNDKTSMEGAVFDVYRVGDYAHYVIRFQNTGNDVAENIVVTDKLENNFDWNYVELTQTSHPCVFNQTGNKLEFIFQQINLPAVSVDEPGSHGFIAFKIKTKSTLVLGDSLKNTAAIYFDYNLPVITNLAGSEVKEIHTVPISIEYFRGNRQQDKHNLTWKANCTSTEAKFSIERSNDASHYSSIGNIIASNTRCLQPFDFTDNNPLPGMNYYRIKMTDIDGKSNYSIVIALLNKKAGFEIVNLVPNPVTNGTGSLNITSTKKQTVNILVTDAAGKTVQSATRQVIAGFTQLNMNFSNLSAGVYTITVQTTDGERKTKQFIKQ